MSRPFSEYRFLALEPVDSWFFREPRPFHADESAAGGMETLFPPPSRTVVGALRAAMARAAGWPGRGQWSTEICEVLGDGDDLGALRFAGPFVRSAGEVLWPAPATVLVSGEKDGAGTKTGLEAAAVLRPGEPTLCDLGRVRLPEPRRSSADKNAPLRRVTNLWTDADILGRILAGEIPRAELRRPASFLARERRIGIARDPETRTAREHALYSTRHVRPGDSTDLVMGVRGVPDEWLDRIEGSVVPLGGEGRQAVLCSASAPALPPAAQIADGGYSLTFLTPAFLSEEAWRPGASMPGFPGRVVTGCSASPQRIGGWDSVGRRPLPARSAVPAGSTWFFELGPEEEAEADATKLHGHHADPDGAGRWGYGLMAIGTF